MVLFPGCSRRFAELVIRLRALDERFLPAVTDPTGHYTDEQYDMTRAHMLLVHAEIEAFLEEACHDVLKHAKARWDTTSEPAQPLLALLSMSKNEVAAIPSQRVIGPSTVRRVIDECAAGYGNRLAQNHGIKERNILALALPVGVLESDLSASWLAEMDSFGGDRGLHAHASAAVTTLPDPIDQRQKVLRILEGLCKLDQKLLQMMRN